jgi:hypothetical protein
VGKSQAASAFVGQLELDLGVGEGFTMLQNPGFLDAMAGGSGRTMAAGGFGGLPGFGGFTNGVSMLTQDNCGNNGKCCCCVTGMCAIVSMPAYGLSTLQMSRFDFEVKFTTTGNLPLSPCSLEAWEWADGFLLTDTPPHYKKWNGPRDWTATHEHFDDINGKYSTAFEDEQRACCEGDPARCDYNLIDEPIMAIGTTDIWKFARYCSCPSWKTDCPEAAYECCCAAIRVEKKSTISVSIYGPFCGEKKDCSPPAVYRSVGTTYSVDINDMWQMRRVGIHKHAFVNVFQGRTFTPGDGKNPDRNRIERKLCAGQ